MPIDKLVDRTKNLSTFTCYGELSPEEILLTLIEFYQGIDGPPTRKVLWNTANATTENLSMDDMDQIVSLRLNHEGTMFGGKTAIVAPQDVTFGLARVFEIRTAGTDREIMVFRTYEEAAEWIEE